MLGTKAATSIGPEGWRNSTLKGIKLSQTIVQKSDKNCDIGRSMDPLPQLRDTVAQLSNEEIHRYTREVRGVVAKLRESLLETNEEIKSLTRGKEQLEKALEHARKDIQLNKDSQENRLSRPTKERDHDGADDLLSAERSHLLNCKKALEAQLKSVQQQLHILDQARKRLFNVLQERSRVLDLLCHALSSIANSAKHSARLSRSRTSLDGRLSRIGPSVTDPLGSYTPETDQALADAYDARNRSAYLRRELKEAIERTDKLTKAAHKSVNDGMTQKYSETVTLKQHLTVGHGENRHAIQRAARWYDATERARGYTMKSAKSLPNLSFKKVDIESDKTITNDEINKKKDTMGPVMSADLSTRERLDRPMVRVFQRHPGTQLPEPQQIIEGGDGLLQSLTATSRNIGLLKLASLRLEDDIRSKSAAASIDGSIIRLRRRKSDHRWTLGAAF